METHLSDTPLARPALQAAALQRVAALPMRRLVTLGVGVLLVLAALAWALAGGREPPWRVLFANLSDKDGGAVIAALSQMSVPHRFSEGGQAILVPADKVHDVRLRLASQGLPKGGTVGFELMEAQRFGATQFQERLNFQRGLEGELARSIMALGAVNMARVHLALPNQTAFLREQQKPSASVLLNLHAGRTLERAQIAGIVHLVAASVPDLQPKAVSVVDQTGALLSQPPGEGTAGLDGAQLQHVRQTEQALTQRIIAILEPIVGPGNVRAQVTADIDFTQSESTAESYGPNQGGAPAAIRSQQLSEAPGAAGPVGGSPGALSNQPAVPAATAVNGTGAQPAPSGQAMRRDAVTNYEVDKTVKVVRSAVGTVRRLSAAVLVNQVTGAGGKPVAATAQQLAQMQALVREAIGLNKERGDSLEVVQAPFSAPAAGTGQVELPLWRDPQVHQLALSVAPWIVLPLVVMLVLLLAVRPVLRAARVPEPPRLQAKVEEPLELATPLAGGEPVALVASNGAAMAPEGQPGHTLLPGQGPDSAREARLETIRELARTDPATVAGVVRKWVGEGA